jgi:hypothetical protein
MRKQKLLKISILLSLLVNTLFVYSQTVYSFSVENKPYTNISGGTLLTNTFATNTYIVSVPYKQELFNQDPGTNWQVGKNGYIIAIGPQFAFALDPFLASLSKKDNTSSIEAKMEIMGNDTVFTIQWKNMKLDSGNVNDYINMQCRVYKKTQTVEFHYGPSSITTADSGSLTSQSGIFWLSKNFQQAYEYNNLKGTSTAPILDRNPQNGTQTLAGFPANGTVFKFEKESTTGIEKIERVNVAVYPNPANETLYVDNKQIETYTITDVSGKEVLKGILETSINLSELNSGVYFITLIGDKVHSTQKLIKQ